ncbi:MAG: hypothetical protein K2X03_29945, partial [Bryobacteraceae bacterium]|nr:hypothetical protein [Bryobacteraceae bacterium]
FWRFSRKPQQNRHIQGTLPHRSRDGLSGFRQPATFFLSFLRSGLDGAVIGVVSGLHDARGACPSWI